MTIIYMVIPEFPPLDWANEDGLLAVGGDLEVESLLLAYRSGIFPWPMHGYPITWFSPPKRALLFLDEVTIPKSLAKWVKRNEINLALNENFAETITYCRKAPRPGQPGTWITKKLLEAYIELHHHGFAHSICAYRGKELIGGLYLVSIGSMCAGESMFHLQDNGSKAALLGLIQYLSRRGGRWIDCQQMTPLVQSFGARLVERKEYLELLTEELNQPAVIAPRLPIRFGLKAPER